MRCRTGSQCRTSNIYMFLFFLLFDFFQFNFFHCYFYTASSIFSSDASSCHSSANHLCATGERQTAPLFALHDDAESERLILVMPCYRIIRNRRKLTTLFFLFSRTRQSKPFSHAIFFSRRTFQLKQRPSCAVRHAAYHLRSTWTNIGRNYYHRIQATSN